MATAKRNHPAPHGRADANSARPSELVPRPETASELLLRQPTTLVGLSAAERRSIVVSAVDDGHGSVIVVSRLGDEVWDLSAHWTVKAARSWERCIKWPVELPPELVDDLKAAAYVWMRRGLPNVGPASASSVQTQTVSALTTVRYLVAAGVRRLDDIEPAQIASYLRESRGKVVPSYLSDSLELINTAWIFREELLYPPQRHPLAGKPPRALGGTDPRLSNQSAMLTPVIPPSVNERLFNWALTVVADAPRLLALRDKGKLAPTARKLLPFRDAALYLVEVTTGMRNSEALELANGCVRKDAKQGVVFHWIRTIDVKTQAGPVEYLMPPELVQVVELLELYAKPLQAQLELEVDAINCALANSPIDASHVAWLDRVGRAAAIQRRNDAKSAMNGLFLGQNGRKRNILGACQIDLMNRGASGEALLRVAKSAGCDWPLNNMQCRRSFAWMAAHSALGVHGAIFLRWQFHHRHLSLSYLYGANPLQDTDLYGELYAEFQEAKTEVMASWFLPDEPLSGGAGKRMMRARATPAQDLPSLLRATAHHITVRSTGHSWCMADSGKCVGGGVYDSHMCGDCSEGVIDGYFAGTWQRIHLLNLKLRKVTDCGPEAARHAERAVKTSEKVLCELGVQVPRLSDHPDYE